MKIRYGLIGCGGFGRFCLEEYQKMPNVVCAAVADENDSLALETARRCGAECMSPAQVLASDGVDLIHLATPPHTHASLGLRALENGKHLLCEKPLALTEEQAEAMLWMAADKGLVLAVNLIMRYNPICAAVKMILEERLLGDPLFASFVNAAQDEVLPAAHWFWDASKSGGIFVEHAVHFFDLFEWWFGEGTVVSAQQFSRPGARLTDQVACSVRYGDATLAHFYHGFHQLLRHDRQDWRIVCELGDLTLSGWLPTTLAIDAMVADKVAHRLEELVPKASFTVVERFRAAARSGTSRQHARTIDVHLLAMATDGQDKMVLYGQMLRSLLADQIASIENPEHRRRVDATNGLRSLRTALAAQAKADSSP